MKNTAVPLKKYYTIINFDKKLFILSVFSKLCLFWRWYKSTLACEPFSVILISFFILFTYPVCRLQLCCISWIFFFLSAGPFLLKLMPDALTAGFITDFLLIVINIIKFNAAYIDEDILSGLVQWVDSISQFQSLVWFFSFPQ